MKVTKFLQFLNLQQVLSGTILLFVLLKKSEVLNLRGKKKSLNLLNSRVLW